MIDFLNNEINIEDEVIYIKGIQTGSSTTRKIMFKGKVVNFKGRKVEIERLYTNEYIIANKEIDLIFPRDVVVLKGE